MNHKAFDKRLAALENTSQVSNEAVKRIFKCMEKNGKRLPYMLDEEKTLEEIAYGAIDWNSPYDMWRVLRGLAQVKQASGDHGRDELVEALKDFLETRGPSTMENTRTPVCGGGDEDIQTANELSLLATWVTLHEETIESIRHNTLKDIPLTNDEEKYIDRYMDAVSRERQSRGQDTYDELFQDEVTQ